MVEGLILIKGGGDIATAVGHKLYRCGFKVIMTETEVPTCIRRTVSFANCVFTGEWQVEGVKAKRVEDLSEAIAHLDAGFIPVLIDPMAEIKNKIGIKAIVDAILAKKNLGTTIGDAPLVIALGPGFTAGKDVDIVIETNRGHNLGRIIMEGEAEKDTGIPGDIGGYQLDRLLKAPTEGYIKNYKSIGDKVKKGDVISTINGNQVVATIDGIVRGLIFDGIWVPKGLKIGDIDPRSNRAFIHTISDKGRCIAGGVLEAILSKG